jgi:hypothetical protein
VEPLPLVLFVEDGRPPVGAGRRVPPEERREAPAVDEAGGAHVGPIGEGGREIVVDHQLVAHHPGGHAGAPDDERHPGRLLVGSAFLEQPMLAPQQPVVRGEHHVGVAQFPPVLEQFQDVAHHLVHVPERPQPVAVLLLQGLDIAGCQPGRVADPPRFVRDVRLVERRRSGERRVLV